MRLDQTDTGYDVIRTVKIDGRHPRTEDYRVCTIPRGCLPSTLPKEVDDLLGRSERVEIQDLYKPIFKSHVDAMLTVEIDRLEQWPRRLEATGAELDVVALKRLDDIAWKIHKLVDKIVKARTASASKQVDGPGVAPSSALPSKAGGDA